MGLNKEKLLKLELVSSKGLYSGLLMGISGIGFKRGRLAITEYSGCRMFIWGMRVILSELLDIIYEY